MEKAGETPLAHYAPHFCGKSKRQCRLWWRCRAGMKKGAQGLLCFAFGRPQRSASKVFLVAATATAVTTVAAAEAAATGSAGLHGTGFVDHEVTAAEIGAMHALDGGLGFSIAA